MPSILSTPCNSHQDSPFSLCPAGNPEVMRVSGRDTDVRNVSILVEQNRTLTRHIFSHLRACLKMFHTRLAQSVGASHTIHVSCACVFDPSSTISSHSPFVPPIFYFILSIFHFTFMWVGSEEFGTLADNTTLTSYEPNVFDNYHFSETTEIFIQECSSDIRPSNLHDLEISNYTIGRALSSRLFTQEREQPAGRRQAYHSQEESFFVQSVVVCRSCKNGETC